MKKAGEIIHALSIASLAVVAGLWPTEFRIQRPAMWVAGVMFVADKVINNGFDGWKWRKEMWVYIIMATYFAITPLMALIHGQDMGDVIVRREIDSRLPFVIFAIVGLAGWPKGMDFKYIAYALIAVATFIGVKDVLMNFDSKSLPHPTTMQGVIDEINYKRLTRFNCHMIANLTFNLAVISTLYIINRKDIKLWIKIIAGIAAIPNIALLIVTEGRVGLATFLLIVVGVLIYYVWRWKKAVVIAVAPLMIATGVAVMANHPRVNWEEVMKNDRIGIWSVAWSQIKEKPIAGWGAIDGRHEFIERGLRMEKEIFETELGPLGNNIYLEHPHNIILNEWVANGAIGVLLLMAMIAAMVIKRRWITVAIVGIFLIQYMFDVFVIVNPLVMGMAGSFMKLNHNKI